MKDDDIIRFASPPRLGEACEVIVSSTAVDANEGPLQIEVYWKEPKQRLEGACSRAVLVAGPGGERRAEITLPGGPLPYEGVWLEVHWYVDVTDAQGTVHHSARFSPAPPTRPSRHYKVRPVDTEIHRVALGSYENALTVFAGLLFAGGALVAIFFTKMYLAFLPVVIGGVVYAAWGAWPMILRHMLFERCHIEVDPMIGMDGYVRVRGTFEPRFRSVAYLTATLKEYEFDGSKRMDVSDSAKTKLRHTYPTAVERISFAPGSPADFDVRMLVAENAAPGQLVGARGVGADLEVTLGTGGRQASGQTQVLVSALSTRVESVELSEKSRRPMRLWEIVAMGMIGLIGGWGRLQIENYGEEGTVTVTERAPLPDFDTSERTLKAYRRAWEAACGADRYTCTQAFNSFHGECFYGKSGNPQPTPSVDVYVRCIQRSWNHSP